ncbi:MAG: HAMP domain-containing protein [Lachnospiraceae bacterium]|nr:HAMP domain-containing protein [Lachnospiraceae bacterium]
MISKKPTKKLTIRMQVTLLCIALTVLVVVLCWVINSTCLERYYLWNKEKNLYEAYKSFNTAAVEGVLDTEEYDIEWQKICGKYNISAIILDADSKSIKCSSNEVDMLMRQLMEYLFKPSGSVWEPGAQIIEETEKMTLQITKDPRIKTEYLELWGVLDNGNLFLMRSAMESIKDSVEISNQFLAYAGLIAIVIGTCFVHFLSKTISRPILELAEISDKMKGLDFDVKYRGNGTAEIDTLGKNINELSQTLEITISELKTANNELQRDIEKKEKIDEMRREFLSNVSHELKTPIALIQGYAEGLKEGIHDDEESKEFYCSVIMDEAAKMNTMVKKLMTLNQLEFGNDPIVMERFDLVALINNCLQSASILIRQKDALVKIEDYQPIYVWADEFKIEEVFLNYLSNALNHLDGERLINIRLDENEDKIRLSVFNTGEPIADEALPYLWDKFYKADKARTREYGGSGIGLSIVKAIMESHHQNYGVNNFENGVEFWVELSASEV